MADEEAPMTTQREVRQRNRGLYWIVALLALVVLCFALFGFADDLVEDGALGSDSLEAPVNEVVD